MNQVGAVRLGVDPKWPPIEFINDLGKYQGISSDYVHLLSGLLGLEMVPVSDLSWQQVIARVKLGEVDLLPAVAYSKHREQFLNFTKPYISHPMVVFTSNQAEFIGGLDELSDKRVIVEKGYVTEDHLRRDYPKIQLILVDETKQALTKLSQGEADAYVGGLAVGSYLIKKNGLTNLKVAAPSPYSYDIAMAVRKDWPELVPIIQLGLDAITEQEKIAIRKRWLAIQYDVDVDYSLVWRVVGVSIVLLALAILWLFQVRRHTRMLQASESRFELAMFAVAQSIWEWNCITGERHFTPSLFLELGYKEEEIPTTNDDWLAMIHPDDRSERKVKLAAQERDPLNRDERIELSYRVRRADRGYAHVVAGGKVTERDKSGNTIKRVGTIRDITVQKEAEEQFKLLINALPASVVVADTAGKILLHNPEAAREYKSADNLVGRNTVEFYADPGERDRLLEILSREGNVTRLPVKYKMDDNTRIDSLLSIIPIRFKGRPAFLGVMVNITDRIEMEESLAEAKEAAEEANRFKSSFLANMSHEIRTPMNAILGLGYLALKTDLTTRQRNYIEKIHSSAEALLGLINDILDVSKIEAGKLDIESVEFCLGDVLDKLSSMLAMRAQDKGLELIYSIANNVPENLMGDPLRLGQVLINLIANAVKFTEQGEIVLRIECVEQNSNSVTLCFSVIDTGIGIAQEQVDRLFLAFSQADESHSRHYGGTGLGLAVSHLLVDLMGGSKIGVMSTEGQGSRFSFQLSFALPATDSSVRETVVDHAKSHILIVDDNPTARRILSEQLESSQYDVSLAVSGADAIQRIEKMFEANEKLFDLILMDWQMPGVNGVAASNTLRATKKLPTIPIIIMSQSCDRGEIKSQAEQAGLEGCLEKPFAPATLITEINRVLEGGYALTGKSPADWFLSELMGRVLVVEDNKINQMVAKEVLQGFGLSVDVADDGDAGLAAIGDGAFDLVLMDIQMPGMDGFETTRKIRENPSWCDLPVLAMTAHTMVGERDKCLAAGMDDHVAKPIDPQRLYTALAEWLPYKNSGNRLQSRPEKPTPSQIKTLPGMEIDIGIQRVGGSRKLFRKLLGDFLQDHGNDIDNIGLVIGRGEYALAELNVHTIHGVAGHIGARDLQRAAGSLEHALSIQGASIQSKYEEFRTAFSQTATNISSWLELGSVSDSKVVPKYTVQYDIEFIAELDKLLVRGSPYVGELLARLETTGLSVEVEDKISLLNRYVDVYDFQNARSVVAILKELHISQKG